jgi:uncharacterized membrane protein
MLFALTLAACMGAGTVGGVFFAFSSFVMRALAQLPAAQGVAAMQRINVVVLRPAFLGVFIGTVALSLAAAALSRLNAWAVAAALLYVAGSFGVTMMFNVPRNNRLAALQAESPQATTYWPQYVREWLLWNHVRTAASLAASACSAASRLLRGTLKAIVTPNEPTT